jgi:hypothetical protein
VRLDLEPHCECLNEIRGPSTAVNGERSSSRKQIIGPTSSKGEPFGYILGSAAARVSVFSKSYFDDRATDYTKSVATIHLPYNAEVLVIYDTRRY